MTTSQTHPSNPQAGFILLKLAIGMIVVGLLTVAILRVFQQEDERNLRIENEQKLNVITDALARYLYQNRRYPCPASITIDPGNANFGREDCSTGNFNGRKLDSLFDPQPAIIGSVPVDDLGLPFDYITDAYHNRYTYVVSFAQSRSMVPYSPGNGQLTVHNVDNARNILTTRNNIDFVLISHGPDGKGAYKLNTNSGGANIPPAALVSCSSSNAVDANNMRIGAGALDANNCHDRSSNLSLNTYVDAPYAPQANINAAVHYDDQIVYSFALKDTATWKVQQNAASSQVDLIMGDANNNVDIGTPSGRGNEKLHVNGGFEVQSLNNFQCNPPGGPNPALPTCGISIDVNKIETDGQIVGDKIDVDGVVSGKKFTR